MLQSRRCSRNSRSASSAQWRSSTTRTHGRFAASASRNLRQAVNASSRETAAPSPPAPTSGPRRESNHARSDSSSTRPATVSPELRGRQVLVVGLEDAGLGLDDLAERPERDPLAVRQAAAVSPGDDVRPVVERRAQLGYEPALADARLAEHGDELHRRLALRAEERLEQERALVLAADERRVRRGLGLADAAPRVRRAPDGDRIRLALRDDRLEGLVGDRALRRPHRRLVDEDVAHRSGRLQAGGDVDDVARDDALAALRARTERDDGLAGRDRGAHGELETFLAELLDRLEDPEPGADRALGVVLVGDGSPEDGHDRVADELLDGPAEPLDVGLHPLVVGAQRRPHVLRVGPVGAAGEPDEVDEQHGDDLALLPRGRGDLE